MKLKHLTIVILGVLCAANLTVTQAQAGNEAPPITRAPDGRAPVNTFTVTKLTDSGDNSNPGTGTLRRAMLDANNTAGFDHLVFDIPGSGVQTIIINNFLPTFTDERGVWLDGKHKADGSANDDQIELDGSKISGHHGLQLTSSNNIIEGITINGVKSAAGISIENSNNNKIIGNRLGTNPEGTVAKPNFAGIQLVNANDNFIGGLNDVRPGGACIGDCNLISGNSPHGIVISKNSQRNQVIANFVGLNRQGTGALKNTGDGILVVESPNNTVGGDTPEERNVISGNGVIGIEVGAESSHHNLIQGNFIGTNSAGSGVVSVGGTGIEMVTGTHDNVIDGNVISGHKDYAIMVFLNATRIEIKNNRIGMAATTDTKMGNGGQGIRVKANNNSIHNNRIAYNGTDGVYIGDVTKSQKSIGNLISQNSIFDNGKFGINITATHLKNLPTLKSAVVRTGKLVIKGNISGRPPGATFTIELFQNPACDKVFNNTVGEGQVYIGFKQVTTDSTGFAKFVLRSRSAPKTGVVTATATDNRNTTGEFSVCKTIKS